MIARANCSVASGQAKELIRFTPADASVLGIRSVSAAGEIACAYSRKNQKNKESPTCKPMLGHRDQTRELGAPLSPIVASTPSVGAIGATVSRSSKIEVFHQSRRLWHGCEDGRYEPYDKSWNSSVLLMESLWKAFR
jgi:hypothetical protein